jgi:hypothetical protein
MGDVFDQRRASLKALALGVATCLAETIAVMYFRKSTPHLSHVPRCRCSLLARGAFITWCGMAAAAEAMVQ